MTELSCRQARLGLQEPETLPPLEARRLERHLRVCPDCATYRREQVEMDHLLRQQLGAAASPLSVRDRVHARLASQPRPARRRTGLPRPLLLIASLAVAAALVALILPQPASKRVVVHAAWHLKRATIGFPLTVDPTRPDHLLVGAAGRLYQSWNGGESWARLPSFPSGLVIRDLAIDATHPRHYLVAVKHSILRSTDAGQHWQTVASNLRGAEVMFLLQDQQHPATFYAGPSVLWVSRNGGRSWSQDGRGLVFAPDGIQALTQRGSTLYTGIWAGGVALSANGGRSWRRLEHGLAPNVLAVAATGETLWAATDRGIYRSANGGQSWHPRGLHHILTTSVLATGHTLLAGGNGGLFRSSDGGRHWRLSSTGLPLAPYVYSLYPSPGHPRRVYASLDGDGVFRSDDAGLHWHPITGGLPIRPSTTAAPVLFRRSGVLWLTNARGADPGTITVDGQVRAAALSPDGAAAAYVTGGTSWSVRLVGAGGSLAQTLVTGTGSPPRRLFWSPTSTRLAFRQGRRLMVAGLSGPLLSRPVPSKTRVLGWLDGGRWVALWQGRTGRLVTLEVATGQQQVGARYAIAPLLSSAGQLAWVHAGRLWVGPPGGSALPVARVGGCRPAAWSDDSSRLLLACHRGDQLRTARGRLIASLPFTGAARFAPGSTTAVLRFQHGALWRWSARTGMRRLVSDAQPA